MTRRSSRSWSDGILLLSWIFANASIASAAFFFASKRFRDIKVGRSLWLSQRYEEAWVQTYEEIKSTALSALPLPFLALVEVYWSTSMQG